MNAPRPIDRAATCRESGYSLLEVTISFTLLTILASLVTSFALSGSRAQKFAERLSRVTEIAQELAGEIREELQSSVRLFPAGTLADSYLNVLDEDGLPTNVSTTLPTLDTAGIFETEATAGVKTGNQLLFARYAWTTEFQAVSGESYRVDVYRLVHYYLAEAGNGVQPGSPIGINLCKFVSEPLAAASQIDAITDPLDQIDVLTHLRDGTPDVTGVSHPPVEVVWELGADPATTGTFRQITGLGALSDTPLSPRSTPWEILSDQRLTDSDILIYRRHSMATIYAPDVMRSTLFAVEDTTAAGGVGFPNGLELQIVGPASARKVLIRLVVTTTNNDGRKPFYGIDLVADCRDI